MKEYKNILEKVIKILLSEWDPIDVKDEPNAQDEYNQYALHIVGMLVNGTTQEDIKEYLDYVVRECIELKVDEDTSTKVANMIFGLKA